MRDVSAQKKRVAATVRETLEMALWPAQKRRSGAQVKETRRKDHELVHYNTIFPNVRHFDVDNPDLISSAPRDVDDGAPPQWLYLAPPCEYSAAVVPRSRDKSTRFVVHGVSAPAEVGAFIVKFLKRPMRAAALLNPPRIGRLFVPDPDSIHDAVACCSLYRTSRSTCLIRSKLTESGAMQSCACGSTFLSGRRSNL